MINNAKAVKAIVWAGIIAGIVFGFWLCQRQPPTHEAQVAKSSNFANSEAPSASSMQSQPPSTASQTLIETEAERVKRIWDEGVTTPIQFYGKVVDEKGHPVEGAKASISIADRLEEGNTKMEKLTDANGIFSVSGHGLGVSVMVSKVGYHHLEQSNGSFGYADGAGTGAPHPNANNPAIFMLRKMGKTEPLVEIEKYVRIPKDGTPIELSLTSGKVVPDGQGDIKIEVWTADQNHRLNLEEPYDWRCRLTVPNGGLTQRTDQFDFEAPVDGYVASDEINMPASLGPTWRHNVARNYFLKLSGDRYARIEFEMMASGEHLFAITSYLNPEPGSHNLEFDPSQQTSGP